jgi:NRAMP (natural resistance-associated macrophage protein)-like metal ion transporter
MSLLLSIAAGCLSRLAVYRGWLSIAAGCLSRLVGRHHDRLPPPLTRTLWVVSEIGAIATDLAELLGASIGCALLLGTSLLTGTLVAGALSWIILAYHEQSFRAVEALITALVLVIGFCFLVEIGLIPVDWQAVTFHSFVPSFGGSDGVLLASGLSSSVVGTMAGQVIMQDFIDWRIPLWVRRLVTILPTIMVAA